MMERSSKTAYIFAPVTSDSIIGDIYWYTIGINDSGTTVNYYVVAIDDHETRAQSSPYSYQVEGSETGFAYLPGDVNMAGGTWPPAATGPDVTYLVNFFRGLPSSLPCRLDEFWASADANGDCNVIGSDVTKLVNVFRGITTISYCESYPPLWLSPGDVPIEAPGGWPNCDETIVSGNSILLKTGQH